jgi:hypothetical protein
MISKIQAAVQLVPESTVLELKMPVEDEKDTSYQVLI